MAYSLGVDLGTSTVAAAVAHGPRVEMVVLGERTVAVPAVVHARGDGSVATGDAAERLALTRPDRTGRALVRRLGEPTPIELGGCPYDVTALLAALLADAVARVVAAEGAPPDRVVLAHPAAWGGYRRDLFAEVARLAGVAPVRTVTAPEAVVAHHAAAGRLRDGAIVVVYDLGGGVFEATVLRRHSTGVDVLGIEGVDLGGVDVDEAVLAHVDRACDGALSALDPADLRAAAALARLRRDVVAAKEALSVDVEVAVPVLLPDRSVEVRLTRGDLDDMIRVALAATIAALTRALRTAAVAPDALDAVLLVGGSSRIPLVARTVGDALHRPVVLDDRPEHAVALGAAVLADAASGTATAVPRAAPAVAAAVAAVEDDVQFTLYRPARIAPLDWCPLLVYTHRAAPFVDERTGHVVDPEREVADDAQRELPPGRDYGRVGADSDRPLPRGTGLVLQPWLSEGFVDPPHHALTWQGSMQRARFQICAPAAPRGPRLVGGVRVYQGPLLVAETRFAIPLTTAAPVAAPLATERITRYRRIFASYSRRDLAVVEAVKDYNLMGDEYLIDLLALRPGEKWAPRLIELIEQADVFQLFWSRNAMASNHVRREWEHALSLGKPEFVRPVYWEDPRPTDPARALPPPTLEELHWSRLPTTRLPRPDPGPGAGWAVAATATGSYGDPPAVPAARSGAPEVDTASHPPARSGRHRGLLTAALVGVLVVLVGPLAFLQRSAVPDVGVPAPVIVTAVPGGVVGAPPDIGGAGDGSAGGEASRGGGSGTGAEPVRPGAGAAPPIGLGAPPVATPRRPAPTGAATRTATATRCPSPPPATPSLRPAPHDALASPCPTSPPARVAPPPVSVVPTSVP